MSLFKIQELNENDLYVGYFLGIFLQIIASTCTFNARHIIVRVTDDLIVTIVVIIMSYI